MVVNIISYILNNISKRTKLAYKYLMLNNCKSDKVEFVLSY